MAGERHHELGKGTILFLASACGVVVANNYYNQAMLADIAKELDPIGNHIGLVPTLTQVGFSAGLLFLLPLGDRVERRRLIVGMAAALCIVLLGAALSPNLGILCVSSVLIGAMATIGQQIIPFGAQLAGPARAGKVVGTLMSGLLLGILLARVVGGAVSAHAGWRVMFGIAAVVVGVFVVFLRGALPLASPTTTLSYPRLLASLWSLVRTQPVLRESSAMGAMFFAAFSVFWSTMALLLEGPQFHLNGDAVGLFGVVGAAGVVASPVAGRLADNGGGRKVLWGACALAVVSYLVLGFSGKSIGGLVAGVILLDLAVWAAQTTNQQRIFAIAPEARSRLNTVYMVCYFAGGALGSAAGSVAWRYGGWIAVAWVGGLFAAVPSLFLALGVRSRAPETVHAGGAEV